MQRWQSELLARYKNNVAIKDEVTAIVNKPFTSEMLFDRITKRINSYLVETLNPKGECKNSISLISIYSYM
jgi:hypothetical protein